MSIYHVAYRIRMQEALCEDFPKVKELLGAAVFKKLALDYLEAHPSQSWTLSDFGAKFENFIAQTDFARTHTSLPELARLEWLKATLVAAPQDTVFELSALASFSNDTIDSLVLKLSSSAALFEGSEDCLLVLRDQDGDVVELPLSLDQWNLLSRISNKISIVDLAEQMQHLDANAVTQWFTEWSAKGAITYEIEKAHQEI